MQKSETLVAAPLDNLDRTSFDRPGLGSKAQSSSETLVPIARRDLDRTGLGLWAQSSLEELIGVLDSIREISLEIIRISLPIMATLVDPHNKYVDDLKRELIANGIDLGANETDAVSAVLQEITLGWIKDAELIAVEIDLFLTPTVEGTTTEPTINEGCTFLYSVWSGDTYDKQEIAGLEELFKELQNTHDGVSEENLLREAKDILLGD